jgi:Fe-S oxidoreductase
LVEKAAESGCIGMYFGIESGNKDILKRIHKPSGVKHYMKLGGLMEQYPNIFTRGFLIIGFPNETYGQMLDTVKVSQAMKLDWCTVQLLTPLPNTEIYNEMVDEGLIEHGTLNLSSDGYTMFSVRESERQRLQELKEQTNSKNFNNFLEKNIDIVPTKQELDDLWFLIDYKVNYEKIFDEDNDLRLQKMKCFLTDISERMSIDNPLSLLFLGIVEEKLGNVKNSKINYSKAKKSLYKSKYWINRFNMLELEIP